METVKERINSLYEQLRIVKKVHQEEIDAILKKIREVQTSCPHVNVNRWYGYETGGTECLDCGKEL